MIINILLIFIIFYLFEKFLTEKFTYLPYPKRKWKKCNKIQDFNEYSDCHKSKEYKSKEWKGWKRDPSKCLNNL
jgi:hypothetical protein